MNKSKSLKEFTWESMDKDGSLIRKEVQRNTVMISTFMKKNICIAKKIINICIAKTKVNT